MRKECWRFHFAGLFNDLSSAIDFYWQWNLIQCISCDEYPMVKPMEQTKAINFSKSLLIAIAYLPVVISRSFQMKTKREFSLRQVVSRNEY